MHHGMKTLDLDHLFAERTLAPLNVALNESLVVPLGIRQPSEGCICVDDLLAFRHVKSSAQTELLSPQLAGEPQKAR